MLKRAPRALRFSRSVPAKLLAVAGAAILLSSWPAAVQAQPVGAPSTVEAQLQTLVRSDPELAAFCRSRFAAEIPAGRLTIVEGAIVENARPGGTIRFYKNKDKSVWGTVDEHWAERNVGLGADSEVIEVPTINFADCLQKYGIPYYLKIDIEGMDLICLRALRDFDSKPDYVSIESEKRAFNQLKAEIQLLRELGYDRFQAVNQLKVRVDKEPQNSREGRYTGHRFQLGASGLFGKDLPRRKWESAERVLQTYKGIFTAYRLLGDDSPLHRYYLGRRFAGVLSRLFHLPGWFDTHARHASVQDQAGPER